jgi:hypothetical protein
MIRSVQGMVVATLFLAGLRTAAAAERPLEELPRDVLGLAFMWTEPLKQVAEHSRRHDPVSGLWMGLVDGSVKSVERTARIFLPEGAATAPEPEPGKILRYTF